MMKAIITEYGAKWVINRALYLAKIKLMSKLPITESLFEENVKVQRVNIFNINVGKIENFLKSLEPRRKNEIITVADKAIRGKITGFSSIELDYENPINWHYSPLTQQKTNRNVKWYEIPDFDAQRGDIKAIWEASRFTHFLYFARAYLITGNEKYYTAFSEQLKQWLIDNPYPYGVNYKCGQECTLRMINVLLAYTVFAQRITNEDIQNVFRLVEVCYKKVLSNFFYAHKCIKNNHTLSEIGGLIIGAWCSNDSTRLHRAYQLLDKEIQNQFTADGGYIQHSFNYQRFALQIMECICKLSEKTGLSISSKSRNLLKNSALLLYQCQDESKDVPNYGSNDGALIFPVTVCGYRDFTPVINTMYALLTGKRLAETGLHEEEMLWFGNETSLPVVNIAKKSAAFKYAGLYTLRRNDGFVMIALQDFKTRPAHMDGLHMDIWHKGRNIFCDCGTYSYADEIGKKMARTAAHNTVKIHNVEQMSSYGNFMLYNWSSCLDIAVTENRFKGAMISKNGYTHARQIEKTEQGYEVIDEISGNGEACSLLFHTPYEVKAVLDGFEVFDEEKRLCSVRVQAGNISFCKTFRSLYYLQKEEINCVAVTLMLRGGRCQFEASIKLE